MITTVKVTQGVPVRKQTEVLETTSTRYMKSARYVAEAQKKNLDLAVQYNASLMDVWKNLAQVKGPPASTILDSAANMVGQFVDLQKGAIDLAVKQGQTLAVLATERVDPVAKATEAVTAIMHNTADRVAAIQNEVLDFSASQAKPLFANFKKQAGVAGTPVEAATESMERGFNALVETQKQMVTVGLKWPVTVKASA